MKKLILLILLVFGFGIINAQTYNKKIKVADFGTWKKEISSTNIISISSFLTKEKITTFGDYEQKQRMVSNVPKNRFELYLKSNSLKNNESVNTLIYGARVFIDSVEVTHAQFPKGFTAIIKTEPTLVYWYETSLDSINIKISWESSNYSEYKH